VRRAYGNAMAAAVFTAGLCAAAARAQPAARTAAGPSEDQLADAVQLGTVATLAPLCGLRDEGWAADLRRAAIQSATRSKAHDDLGLKAAPGSDLATGALSFAETEALESFAEAPATATCEPLARNPGLRRADALVQDYRMQVASPEPGS
jgi:hypothetical protein